MGWSGRQEVCRHRVMSPVTPGMTTHHPPAPQGQAAPGPMLLQGLQGIGRAGGLETTGIAQPGLEQQAVATHEQHEAVPGRVDQPFLHARTGGSAVAPARARSCSSSPRAAWARASERAETNCVAANGERRRTSHCPAGSWAACRANTARICRFSRLRVTARLAWRFGTTQPSQCPEGESSTGRGFAGTKPVDKSVAKLGTTALPAGLRTGKGPCARWCKAK